MRFRAWMAAAVCSVVVAFTGCSGSSDPRNPSTETPQAGGSAERSATVAAEPQPGTCWAVPAASVVDQEYWFDDSAQVPCTEPHTTETAMSFSLPEPTIAEAMKALNFCDRHVRSYLGVDPDSWVPWGQVAFLPSREEVAAGASWVRCDAFFPATTRHSSARTTNVSAKGIADAPPGEFWACTDMPPHGPDQPFVPCDRPHDYEQTGSLAILTSITVYPSAAERSAEARRQCREGVPVGYDDDVAVAAVWDPRSAFQEGTELAGWCFMFYPDGRALPAR